ncbi:uridine kinase [Pseudonocardia humida]|uniref:Uridine kinase n=1 Tax=Pseudonocardia humida TaxID=2800819 RepID=A0ABT0ZTP4_9PSEU|nr:uridine kinase [Pseudonocardia humida]MCO1654102.1 uridine kinase [Pseudonocardia humida]
MVARADLLDALTATIAATVLPHPLRVAIDGPDAAGKTTTADELATRLAPHRPVVRAGVDDFHRPRAERLRRGALSPHGYLEDSFDLRAVVDDVLAPLGPGGDRRYRSAAFDHRTDAPRPGPVAVAPPDAVLLFDGVFLLRPPLLGHWDLTVHLHIDEAEVLRRARVRDAALFGAGLDRRYSSRYLPGQRLYRERHDPAGTAHVLIDHTDPRRPVLRRPASLADLRRVDH